MSADGGTNLFGPGATLGSRYRLERIVDVLKALALGARAVLIGRAYLWGLAVAGEDGVRDVLRILRDELELSMALAGRTSVAAIDSSLIRRP